MAGKEIVITREFDAPRDVLWKMWNDPEMFRKWWGPKDFSAPVARMDFHENGNFVYCMRGKMPDGKFQTSCSTGRYTEIVPKEKIVSTMSFADENGNAVPASRFNLPGDWPKEIMMSVTFEGDDRTKMTIKQSGVPEEMIEMSKQGWEQSLDKMEAAI